jgi:hypothetical protein
LRWHWLEHLAAAKSPLPVNEEGKFDPGQVTQRLEFFAIEANRSIAGIHELCDLQPSLAGNPAIKLALQEICAVSKRLFGFLKSERLVTGR